MYDLLSIRVKAMTLQQFLDEALRLTFEIDFKRQHAATLLEEAKKLEETMEVFQKSVDTKEIFDIVYYENIVYYDRESDQLFLVEQCSKTGKVLFSTVTPANFNVNQIVDEIDENGSITVDSPNIESS